ncbi:aminopeptidase N C-terminal domain-containing protein [Methylobacterium nigriterrae]
MPLTRWRKYDEARQALMRGELERILASGELSSDVYEVVSKSLA